LNCNTAFAVVIEAVNVRAVRVVAVDVGEFKVEAFVVCCTTKPDFRFDLSSLGSARLGTIVSAAGIV
jgi:hypothetical protein